MQYIHNIHSIPLLGEYAHLGDRHAFLPGLKNEHCGAGEASLTMSNGNV